jgi:4'-phosphopantetheinyl transferase
MHRAIHADTLCKLMIRRCFWMSPFTDMALTAVTLHSTSSMGAPTRPADSDTFLSPVLRAQDPQKLLARQDACSIRPDTVQVWAFVLDGPPDFIERCRSLLSPEERQRADRFVFERDRIRHTVAHALLRHLLSRYCLSDFPSLSPQSLRFSTTQPGKPALQFPTVPLQFNLTHSEDRALLAVSAGFALGVDLEKVRSNIEALSISRHYFFGSERDDIEKAPEETRAETFFRYWVAKEAVLKAQGIGLGFPLDRFRVAFDGHAAGEGHTNNATVETLEPERLAPGWHVRLLPCEAGWLGAVAAAGSDWDIECKDPRL